MIVKKKKNSGNNLSDSKLDMTSFPGAPVF